MALNARVWLQVVSTFVAVVVGIAFIAIQVAERKGVDLVDWHAIENKFNKQFDSNRDGCAPRRCTLSCHGGI